MFLTVSISLAQIMTVAIELLTTNFLKVDVFQLNFKRREGASLPYMEGGWFQIEPSPLQVWRSDSQRL